MTLRAQMADDLAEILADGEFCPAETVVWLPRRGGDPVSGVKIVHQSNGRGLAEGQGGQHEVSAATAFVTVAERATVEIDDRYTRTLSDNSTETWAVVDIVSESPVVRELNVQKVAKVAFIGAGDRLGISRASPV